jgi:hypothetical protein
LRALILSLVLLESEAEMIVSGAMAEHGSQILRKP